MAAIAELEAAIFDYVAHEPTGVRNDEVARDLELRTSYNGGQRNYLTFTLLNRMVEAGAVRREKRGSRVYYLRND